MNISSVSNYNNTANLYSQMSSGKRINSAADDAAGLTIAKKMEKQESGLNVGAYNAQTGNAVTKIADGALGGIGDSLQRIHELSLRASNGLMTQADKRGIQSEIDSLLNNISQMADGTEYNTKKILNGDPNAINLAVNPDGSGMDMQKGNATLQALGLDGYNVMGNFDISRVTNALDIVNSQRSGFGATSNALDYTYAGNMNTAENTTAARSVLEDLEYMSAISNKKKNDVLDTFQIMMQKQQQDDETKRNLGLFNQ